MVGWFFTTLPLASSADTSSTVLKPPFAAELGPWQGLQYVVTVASAFNAAGTHATCAAVGGVAGMTALPASAGFAALAGLFVTPASFFDGFGALAATPASAQVSVGAFMLVVVTGSPGPFP